MLDQKLSDKNIACKVDINASNLCPHNSTPNQNRATNQIGSADQLQTPTKPKMSSKLGTFQNPGSLAACLRSPTAKDSPLAEQMKRHPFEHEFSALLRRVGDQAIDLSEL